MKGSGSLDSLLFYLLFVKFRFESSKNDNLSKFVKKVVVVILFLNDVSGSEILLILLFILIFFGSKSIPGIARTMGRTMRQIKDATDEIQTEIKKSAGDYKKDLNLDGIFKETSEEIRRPLDQMVDDLDDSVRYETPKRVAPVPMNVPEDVTQVAEEASQEKPTEIADNLQVVEADKMKKENS